LKSIRPKVEAALTATAERLSPGAGHDTVHHAKNDLSTIDASSENLSRRYEHEDVAIATPAVFEAKHPDGDPVSVGKPHDGVIIVFPDSFIFVRGIGFGAREVKALGKSDVTVERVSMVLEGATVPGLRINGPNGKPMFAAAIAIEGRACQLTAQEAVRDEIASVLTA
jgi:hypothetical protein